MPRRLTLAFSFAIALIGLLGGASAAQAEPGSLRILVVSNIPDPDLPAALAARPDVSVLDEFDSSDGTPSPESLATYDLVVGTGDSTYDDAELWGNRLADFIDAGGALIQFAYDNWEDTGAHPTGRFESGGYPPFIPGPNDNQLTSLGEILVPDSPLLAGVPSFTTGDNTTVAPAPGATVLARWADGRNAIATKGRVVSVSASPQGVAIEPIEAAAQLAANAGNSLGRHLLTVTKAGTGGGTVSSASAGIHCGATCSARLPFGSAATLTAEPDASSAFTGWGGACSGVAPCQTTIGATDQAVTANFASTDFSFGKAKRNKRKGTAKLAVEVPGPGALELAGKSLKRSSKQASAAGTVKLKVKAKGKKKRKLNRKGKAKVKPQVSYTPTGASESAKSTKSKKVKLVKR